MKIETAMSKFITEEDVDKQEASPLLQCIEDNLEALLDRLKIRGVSVQSIKRDLVYWVPHYH